LKSWKAIYKKKKKKISLPTDPNFSDHTIGNTHIFFLALPSARQYKESEKGLFNTKKKQTNTCTRTYVNQRDQSSR
jgi:hypothetical protein